jgi:hypothetical protein
MYKLINYDEMIKSLLYNISALQEQVKQLKIAKKAQIKELGVLTPSSPEAKGE